MKQSLLIGFIVSLQLFATIAIQLLIIRIIGVGSETDAYIAAQTIPSILSSIIITVLQSVWLPRLSILKDNILSWRNEQAIAQGQGLLVGMGVIVPVYLILPVLIPLIFPGLDKEVARRVLFFSSPLLLSAIFNIQTALLVVALRARSRFVISELISMLISMLVLIVVVLVLPQYGLEAVVLINLIRAVIVYIIQMSLATWPLPSIIKGWQCKSTWKMMKPLFLGASLYKTSPLVDRYWLSQVSSGGITIYSLAQTIMGMIATVIERVIAMPLKPTFSIYIKNSDYVGLKKAYQYSIYKITMVVIVIAIIFFLFKDIFILLLIHLLGLEEIMANNVWWVVVLLLGYMHVAVSGAIAVAVFYALEDSYIPMVIGIIGFCFGLVLKWLLFNLNGIYGIASATSGYFLLNILLFVVVLNIKINNLKRIYL